MNWIKGIASLFGWNPVFNYLMLMPLLLVNNPSQLALAASFESIAFFGNNTGGAHPRAEPAQSQRWPEIKGGDLGDECDMDLHAKYTEPLYQATFRQDYDKKHQELRKYLDDNPTLEAKSCFAHLHDTDGPGTFKSRFLGCVAGKCDCIDDEKHPYFSRKSPSDGRCKLQQAELGTPCLPQRTSLVKSKAFDKMRANIYANRNGKPSAIAKILQDFATDWDNFAYNDFLVSDIRRACLLYDNKNSRLNSNVLECKSTKQCGCVVHNNLFQYEPSGGKTCAGKDQSVCELVHFGVSNKAYVFVEVPCAENVCQRPNNLQSNQFSLKACLEKGDDDGSEHFSASLPLLLSLLILLTF